MCQLRKGSACGLGECQLSIDRYVIEKPQIILCCKTMFPHDLQSFPRRKRNQQEMVNIDESDGSSNWRQCRQGRTSNSSTTASPSSFFRFHQRIAQQVSVSNSSSSVLEADHYSFTESGSEYYTKVRALPSIIYCHLRFLDLLHSLWLAVALFY